MISYYLEYLLLLVAFAVGDVTEYNAEMEPNLMPQSHELLWVYTEVT